MSNQLQISGRRRLFRKCLFNRFDEFDNMWYAGLSSLGVPGVPAPPDFVRSVTLSQARGADYSHQIIQAPTDFHTFRRPWYVNCE